MCTFHTSDKLAIRMAREKDFQVIEYTSWGYVCIVFPSIEARTAFIEDVRLEFNRQMSTNP